jgi:hypothetical protein
MPAMALNPEEMEPLNGSEPIRLDGTPLDFSAQSFWQWAYSDLLTTDIRAAFAEFLVGRALGVTQPRIRVDWKGYCHVLPNKVKIEVRSASYLKEGDTMPDSQVLFTIGKSRALDTASRTFSREFIRPAEVYVFSLLKYAGEPTVDPLDLNQWDFYVAPTTVIEEEMGDRHQVSLKRLQDFSTGPLGFHQIAEAVAKAAPAPVEETAVA